jgi:hypothetical protein
LGGGGGPIDTYQFEVLLKIPNVLAALCDAVLIYLILRRTGARSLTARVTAAIFVLNPAVIFIMSVWGSTETISLFFMLLSLWFAVGRHPVPAWIALAFGAFTRPQMVVLGFLLGCVYFRRFGMRDNLSAISWAVIAFFVVMVPLSLAIAPSFPVDYVSRVIGFQIGTGQADNYSAVTPAYYSVWTLPLLYLSNQHGLSRMWYPRTADLVGSISYTEAAAVIVVLFLLGVGATILVRRSYTRWEQYFPLVALGMFGFLMLSTSLISRYFLYGLVLLILCRQSFRSGLYYASVAWLTVVTLVTSWSHFGLDEFGYHLLTNPLNPATNSLSRTVIDLFSNDRFITVGTVANIIVLVVLAVTAIRGTSAVVTRAGGESRPVQEPAAI